MAALETGELRLDMRELSNVYNVLLTLFATSFCHSSLGDCQCCSKARYGKGE